MSLMYGTDPEFFAVYKETTEPTKDPIKDMEFVASPAVFRKFYGIKPVVDDPKHPVFLDRKEYKIIMDGTAFEINYKKPFKTAKEMYTKVHTSINDLGSFVRKYGFDLRCKPVVNFDYNKWWTKDLMKDSNFFQGIIFGCDPDLDAFDVNWLPTILDMSHHQYRYGGGHLHISGDSAIEKWPIIAIKLLAITVGNFHNAHSPFSELEKMRAYYYGKPGKYRIQHYSDQSVGVEYRTPSNAWTNYDYDMFKDMIEMINLAINLLNNPNDGKAVLEKYEQPTIEAITTANSKLSRTIIKEL